MPRSGIRWGHAWHWCRDSKDSAVEQFLKLTAGEWLDLIGKANLPEAIPPDWQAPVVALNPAPCRAPTDSWMSCGPDPDVDNTPGDRSADAVDLVFGVISVHGDANHRAARGHCRRDHRQ